MRYCLALQVRNGLLAVWLLPPKRGHLGGCDAGSDHLPGTDHKLCISAIGNYLASKRSRLLGACCRRFENDVAGRHSRIESGIRSL